MLSLLRSRRAWGTVLLMAGLLGIALWPATVTVDVAAVRRGTLVVTVDEEGRTRVRDRFVVSAPVAGRVLRLELEPGDRVRRGDVVARLQPAMPPLLDIRSRTEAEAAVVAARATLGRARAEEERSAAALAYAEREASRSRRLAAGGVIPTQQVDEREADARLAAEAAKAAAFAVSAATAELHRAQAHLATPAQTLAGPVAITAPADGVILKRLRESEAVVPAGEPLVELGDPADLEVLVDLLSADAARIREGAPAFLESWRGQPPQTARVRRIEPSGFTKVSALGVEEQRVNVILEVGPAGEGDAPLGDGYRVEARIVVREARNVLIVPTSALFRDGDRWAVYEARDGRARQVLVTLGAQTARDAEVVAGLTEGAQVIVHPADRITDGTRVSPRDEEGP